MSTTAASAIRPSLRDNRQLSGSPHTPSRFISSNFSSPGSSFRQEEDATIIELDARSLKAGFEGETSPQCVLSFSPDNARRVGDHRSWHPDYRRHCKTVADEAGEHELWRNDLNDYDLGLMEDKLERAVREAYNKYLLTDAGTARLVLVLPSLVPLPVVSSMLTTFFERWKYTTITMLPAPTMCTLAAGLRSALVVDIGWEETVVTPVYEYRELTSRRSVRGMKRLVAVMAEKLKSVASQVTTIEGAPLRQDFAFVEDFIRRMAFCRSETTTDTELSGKPPNLSSVPASAKSVPQTVSLDWPCDSTTQRVILNKEDIANVVDDALFGQQPEPFHDDHEQPLGQLVYQSLLGLPPDIRGICMSRTTFCGSGSSIDGVKTRIMDKVVTLTSKHGWNAVRGQKIKPPRQGLVEIAQGRTAPADYKHNIDLPPGRDFVDEKLFKQKAKEPQPGSQGKLSSVETLGAWAGASLLISLKIKGVVEVERERFLSHGIVGASREQDVSVTAQRTSTFGTGTIKSSDRTSWTLGSWG